MYKLYTTYGDVKMDVSVKRIGSKGEIIIPKSIRKEKGLETSSKLEIIPTKDCILLIPIKEKLRDLAGLFGEKGVKNIKNLDAITHELLSGM